MAKSQPVQLPWLNDGEPTLLGRIPVKGEERLEALRLEGAHVAKLDYDAWMCHFQASLLMARKVMESEGLDEAHRQWRIAFGTMYSNLDWDVSEFSENITEAIRDFVLTPLCVDTEEEATKLLREKAKEASKALAAVKTDRDTWIHNQRLEEVFWLLWRSKPRPDFMPSDKVIPTEQDVADTKEYISWFLDEDDYGLIVKAVRGSGAVKANVESIIEGMSVEDIQKKVKVT